MGRQAPVGNSWVYAETQNCVSHCAGLVVFDQQTRVTREEGTLVEKMPPSDWHVGKPVGHALVESLMWEGLAHCEWYHHGADGLGRFKKAH